jgi:chromosomal replication initiation ATPase DnaA
MKAVEGEQRIQDRLARRGLDIGQLAQRVAGEFGVDAETIFQRNRTAEVSRAKSVFVYLGGEYLRKSNREMALLTQMSDGAATRSRQRGLALLSSTNLKNWLEVN